MEMTRHSHRLCVAVLDTMWGDIKGLAPRYFQINPQNRSGKRLLAMVDGHYHLYVTNACRTLEDSPDAHGTPDPEWLKENLERLFPIDVLLLCGNVAQETYVRTGLMVSRQQIHHILRIKHPAARTWTALELQVVKEKIRRYSNARTRS